MTFNSKLLTQPGEHSFLFKGKAGQLEGKIRVPPNPRTDLIAMLGHPHSLHGGSMTNKVVTTLSRTMSEEGISSICFNFRGVGKSEGEYDHGIGESEDMGLLMQAVDAEWILAGFSFGSFVVYRAALHHPASLLITIAPPVMRYDYAAVPSCPWWILQGDVDEVVEATEVLKFAHKHPASPHLISLSGASHFFHGNLLVLREKISFILKEEGMSRDVS